MTSFTAGTPLLTKKRGATGAVAGANGSATAGRRQQRYSYDFPLCAGESSRALVDRRRGDPDPRRARANGGCERAGVSPPGTAVRGRPRLLRDGLLRRDRAPERADARLSAGRRRRASARDPDLRL